MQYLLSKYRVTGQSTFRLSSRRTVYAKILYYVLSISSLVLLLRFVYLQIWWPTTVVDIFLPSLKLTCTALKWRGHHLYSRFSVVLLGSPYWSSKFFSQTELSSFDKNVLQERWCCWLITVLFLYKFFLGIDCVELVQSSHPCSWLQDCFSRVLRRWAFFSRFSLQVVKFHLNIYGLLILITTTFCC